MKKIAVIAFLMMESLALLGQGFPDWLDEDFRRMKYPENLYFTGFVYGEISAGRPLQEVTEQMKTEAQADLSRKIRLQITTSSKNEISAVNSGGQYRENESFSNSATTESSVEVVGIKTETYYDPKTRFVYAFANVNRYELIGYHKGNLSMTLAQAEGMLQTAQSLEAAGEKPKARQQCEATKSLLAKVRTSQDLLLVIDPNITPDDLQLTRTETVHNRLTQMLAQLAQAVLVYLESVESNFSAPATVVSNRLKAALAEKGCSFIDDTIQADFRIKITATTRRHGVERGFTVSYADVAVDLLDSHKNRSVFNDEFSQKGISTSQETAGRKALEDAASIIANRISPWIN